MGVDHPEGGRLVAQMYQDAGKHDVLVHVGEIPGVKGVLVVHEFSWCMILSDHALAPAHRRHDDLIAPTSALGDFRTIMEFQILRQTDPDFGQPFPVAVDGYAVCGQT